MITLSEIETFLELEERIIEYASQWFKEYCKIYENIHKKRLNIDKYYNGCKIQDDYICFIGYQSSGCGCCPGDNYELDILIRDIFNPNFLEKTRQTWIEKQNQVESKEVIRKEKEKIQQEEAERAQYKRLKDKFDTKHS